MLHGDKGYHVTKGVNSATQMDISVIVATYNRAGILKGTLESLAALRPQGVTHEIIVVDNNSSDNTREVVEEFAQRAPIRYLFEERQGKNHALNAAVEVAQGELLVFTDDDVFVPADWLDRYWAAAQAHTEADVFGGSVVARLPANAPQWAHHPWLPFGALDLGSERRPLAPGKYFAGANMGVRAANPAAPIKSAAGPGGLALDGGEPGSAGHDARWPAVAED